MLDGDASDVMDAVEEKEDAKMQHEDVLEAGGVTDASNVMDTARGCQ